jgi:glycosyltransferase involved in cell wall biosynthesis
VVTVSRYLERLAWKLGAQPEKTETIYLGVDANRFKPRGKSVFLTIGTLGRLVSQKNIEDLIDVTRLLQERHDVHLRIGGDGLMRGYLEAYAGKVGLRSYEFCGIVTDPVGFHQSLEIFVLCSTREGLSISLQKAMFYGIVPVAVKACGCDELINTGENGFLYRPRDVDDLVRKIELAIGSKLGGKASWTILEGFYSKTNAKKYLRVYKELGHRF